MLSVLVASLVGATSPPGFARVPTPAGASTYAAAVSADGTTVVGQLGLADGSVEAFRWRIGDDTIEVIGDLEGGLHFSSATAVSADGVVVAGTGYRGDPSRPTDGIQVAFTFTTEGGFTVLPDLDGGEVLANATGITADGRIVVGASFDDRNDFIAVAWRDGVVEALGTLNATQARSDARGVSADGRVIVGGSPAGAGAQPRTASFRKVGDGPLQDLGDLDGGATFCSVVTVSDDGHVIVGSASSGLSGENFLEAFRKIDDGPLEPLGDLDGGPFGSDALDVSADGRVIVGRSVVNDDESEEAFIFTDQDGLRRLAEVAVDAGIVVDDTVTLSQATSVSGDGTVVVGNALINDGGDQRHVEAFVVVLPANNDDSVDETGPPELRVDRPASCGGCAGGQGGVGALAFGLLAMRRGKRRHGAGGAGG